MPSAPDEMMSRVNCFGFRFQGLGLRVQGLDAVGLRGDESPHVDCSTAYHLQDVRAQV